MSSMSFEGPNKPSPSEVLQALDNGEIPSGDKGIKRIESEDGTHISYETATGFISYTRNGVLTEAYYIENNIQQPSFKDADNPYRSIDKQNVSYHRDYLQNLVDADLFT